MKGNKKRSQSFRWIALVFGFVLGWCAYWPWLGKVNNLDTTWDLLYYTLKLLAGGIPLSGTVEGLMLWARFLCPTSTGVVLLSYFSAGFDKLWAWARSLNREVTIGGRTYGRDSVAIYGSNDLVRSASQGTHFIQAGAHFLKHARHHVILMNDDDDSLRFYQKHKKDFAGETTYIGIQQISTFLLKSMPDVFYFNIQEEVARSYWKDHSIRREVQEKGHYDLVILGYCRDNLGFQLLRYGILNNLFRRDQKITYHIFCKPEEAVRGFEYLNLMTNDQVLWYTEPWQGHLDILTASDRILLCRTINPHILNQLLLTCTDQQIHYYDPEAAAYPLRNAYADLKPFGCTTRVLNESTILKQELHRDAMDRHFQYIMNHGTQQERQQIRQAEEAGELDELKVRYWNELTGFLKNSNVAASDYYTVYPVEENLTDEILECRAELEHVRWCRFHYLCGWQFGQPEDGSRRDSKKRIHRSLIPWEDLSEGEKEKDRQQVRMELGV